MTGTLQFGDDPDGADQDVADQDGNAVQYNDGTLLTLGYLERTQPIVWGFITRLADENRKIKRQLVQAKSKSAVLRAAVKFVQDGLYREKARLQSEADQEASNTGRPRVAMFRSLDIVKETDAIDPLLYNMMAVFFAHSRRAPHGFINLTSRPNSERLNSENVKPEVNRRRLVERYVGFSTFLYAMGWDNGVPSKIAALASQDGSSRLSVFVNRILIATSRETLRRTVNEYTQDNEDTLWGGTLQEFRDQTVVSSFDNLDYLQPRRAKLAAKEEDGVELDDLTSIHVCSVQTSIPLPNRKTTDLAHRYNRQKVDTATSYNHDDFFPTVEERTVETKFKSICFDIMARRALIHLVEEERDAAVSGDSGAHDIFPTPTAQVPTPPPRPAIPKLSKELIHAALVGDAHLASHLDDDARSKIIHEKVIPVNPDKFYNCQYILNNIKAQCRVGQREKHHIVFGDQKCFDQMVRVQEENPVEYDWLVPFPGGWHLLKCLQNPLFDEYWELGLRNIANGNRKGEERGGLGWTPKLAESRLKEGTNRAFRDRHIFLRQTVEATYVSLICEWYDELKNKEIVDEEEQGNLLALRTLLSKFKFISVTIVQI